MPEIEKYVSMDDIMNHLGVKRDAIMRYINNKGMPAHRVGHLWKFKISEVENWVNQGGAARKNTANRQEQ